MTVKLTFISDTHMAHRGLELEGGDILVHCGDFSHTGTPKQNMDFLEWFSEQDYKHKVFIYGNHELGTAEDTAFHQKLQGLDDVHLLLDSGVELEGLKFWGSPVTPEFGNWAYMMDEGGRRSHWDKIPDDTDVLVTHGPPFEVLDECPDSVGCPHLFCEVVSKNIPYHAFGHIHEGYGEEVTLDTHFINCSIMSERYNPINLPVNIEV